MRRGIRAVATGLCTFLFAANGVGASVAGATGKSLSFEARNCTEVASFFFVDPAVVRPFVPDEFEVAPVVADRAELLVLTTSCETAKSGGKDAPLFFSEVGVYVEKVDPTPFVDWHYYGLWHATDQKQLSRALARLGVTAPYVKGAGLASTSGAVDFQASVPWKVAPYEVEVVSVPRGSLFGTRPSAWWYSDGGGAYVRVVYAIEEETAIQSGIGTIQAAAGSTMATIIGSTSRASDSTMTVRYGTLTATAERIDL